MNSITTMGLEIIIVFMSTLWHNIHDIDIGIHRNNNLPVYHYGLYYYGYNITDRSKSLLRLCQGMIHTYNIDERGIKMNWKATNTAWIEPELTNNNTEFISLLISFNFEIVGRMFDIFSNTNISVRSIPTKNIPGPICWF